MVRTTIEDETSLLAALRVFFPESSSTTLRKMLESGRVRVNGEVEKKSNRALLAGDVIDVGARPTRRDLDPRLELLYEDDDLLVVVKAAGLLTVATPGEREQTAQAFLNEYLRSRGSKERIHVVHRLDRASSGVLVFAKNFETRELLKERFAAHDIERVYIAIIEGTMETREGTIRSHLEEDRSLKVRSVPGGGGGKPAVTHYRTIEEGARWSMLEVRLETGRKNQIRVHLSEAGHPIAGDQTYGAATDPIGRLALHAMVLGFQHPHDGRRMVFTSPLPQSFRGVVKPTASIPTPGA